MRLIGRRDFAWDNDFPGLGMNTTQIYLQFMGKYPKAKLALSSFDSLPPLNGVTETYNVTGVRQKSGL
jgi:hypothetical protein